MANQDANIETNDNNRIINISMKIELKNSESDKEIQELMKNVTRQAIDATLTATNTLNQRNSNKTSTVNIEIARLRRSLGDKKLQNNKNVDDNATSSTKITSASTSGTKKNETPKKERKVTNIEKHRDKGVETDAMKIIRRSLEIKNSKRTKNDISNANSSFDGSTSISGTHEKTSKKIKDAKEAITNKNTNEYENKPFIETETMKRIRRSLELKSKSKQNNNVTATTSTFSPTSSTRTCQSIEGTGNAKSPGKGTKRKVADVGLDKTHVETEETKRMKLINSGQNENNFSTSANTTCEITYEKMDVDDVENVPVPTVISTGSKKTTTQETKRIIEKPGVETEAMKIIRRRLELKKNKNKNEASSSTITSTASRPSSTRVVKNNEIVTSPKPAKPKTATDKPTRTKELKKQKKRSRESETSNATTSSTSRETNAKTAYAEISHENETGEITEDEDDRAVFKARFNNVLSETAEYDKSASTSIPISSYECAMNVEVEQDDNTAARRTRSKTWARRVWKK